MTVVRLTTDLIIGPLVLPDDVDLAPASALDGKLRRRINARAGDYTLSRPGARTGAKVVDSDTASLLQQFRSPTTISEAILDRVRRTGEDPQSLLSAFHPVLVSLIRSRILISVAEAAREEMEARHRPGDVVCGCVIRSLLHVMEDTELYVAHRVNDVDVPVVLKLARLPASESLASIEHEAAILRHLRGGVAPRLIDAGRLGQLDFVVLERRRGVDAGRAASSIRAGRTTNARDELTRLAADIADAYARLHDRGIIHGDVHERNVLVDRDGGVTLLDFGLSRFIDGRDATVVRRGGQSFYYEPEFAAASVENTPFPAASTKSDQYSLAAMVYHLVTGSPYLDFELDEPRALKQIAGAAMVPFERRGLAPWKSMEAALGRALAKQPEHRFATMREFAAALRDAAAAGPPSAATGQARRPTKRRASVATRILRQLAEPDLSAGSLGAPTASIAFGAAGISIGFYRLAQLRENPELLAVADRWSLAARVERRRARAFYDGDELVPGVFGHRAFYYGTSGLDVTAALVAAAMGDFMTLRHATRRLGTLPERTGNALDCMLGLPGTLIGLCEVLDVTPEHELVDPTIVEKAGKACARRIAQAMGRRGDIARERRFANLGIAHGWAGVLYSLMRWHRTSGSPLPVWMRRRLDELAALAEPTDRGIRWPWRDILDPSVPSHYMPGWCNGSAGFVHLWVLAYSIFGDPAYLDLAEGAAWDAFDDPEDTVYDLCCGRAGRAYALLALHRARGADAWLSRAKQLAGEALDLVAKADNPPLGLFKGALGVILLNEELEQSHHARMPVFEYVPRSADNDRIIR